MFFFCVHFFAPSHPDLFNPSPKDIVEVAAPSVQMIVAPPIAPPTAAAPPIDELIHQSQWNLQQQEQHLHTLRQVHVVECEDLFGNPNATKCIPERRRERD